MDEVVAQLRAIPEKGMGYGLLRYLATDTRLTDLPGPSQSFNYLGQLDAGSRQDGFFQNAAESVGMSYCVHQNRAHALDIVAMVRAGCLRIRFSFSQDLRNKEEMQNLADTYRDCLRQLLVNCQQADVGVLRQHELDDAAGALVILRAQGSLPPLYCVHPAGGRVMCYSALAAGLDNRPIYGLEARGLEPGQEPLARMDQMAAYYLAAIHHVAGHLGPDLGWQGKVRHVACIDIPGDHQSMMKKPHVSVLARHLQEVIKI